MSHITDAQKMLLWCRKNGIAFRTLTVGTLTIDGTDTRLAEDAAPPAEAAPRVTMRDRYGAGFLREAAESEGMTSVVEELDD